MKKKDKKSESYLSKLEKEKYEKPDIKIIPIEAEELMAGSVNASISTQEYSSESMDNSGSSQWTNPW